MQTTHNKLVVTIDNQFQDRIDIGGGKHLFVDTKFNPEEKVSITATVESLPRSIRNGLGQKWELGWLKVGDKIMIRYDVLAETRDQPDRDSVRYMNRIDLDGRALWLCDIEQVFAREVNGEWEMLNDYVMLKPMWDEVVSSGLIIVPEQYRRRRKLGLGRVIAGPDQGEMVRFNSKMAQEYEYHGEMILIIRERYVMGTAAGVENISAHS